MPAINGLRNRVGEVAIGDYVALRREALYKKIDDYRGKPVYPEMIEAWE